MSAGRAERILIQHLVDAGSLAILAKEGLPPEMIPSEDLREIYHFAMHEFWRNGMTKAPSIETMIEEHGNVIADNEIDIEHEPDDSVEYALDMLKGAWVNKEAQEFMRAFAEGMNGADPRHRPEVVGEFATRLVGMSTKLERKSIRSDAREDMQARLTAYEQRAADQSRFYGLRTGIAEIDIHTHGIHPGELAIMAAPPKMGKSWALLWSALTDWRNDRAVLLYSLENSVEMTLDRLGCMMAMIDYRAWQRGVCTPDEKARVQEQIKLLSESGAPFLVFQPDLGKRSFEHMVAQARIFDVDSLYIDQLTFVELEEVNKPLTERVGDALHLLKGMISTGRKPIPCMLAHQINREGHKAADKVGHLEMYHMASAAEVERTADWVFGLYASRDDRTAMQIKWQILAARREVPQNWKLAWNPSYGQIASLGTITL